MIAAYVSKPGRPLVGVLSLRCSTISSFLSRLLCLMAVRFGSPATAGIAYIGLAFPLCLACAPSSSRPPPLGSPTVTMASNNVPIKGKGFYSPSIREGGSRKLGFRHRYYIAITRIGNSALHDITNLIPRARVAILGACEDYDSEPYRRPVA